MKKFSLVSMLAKTTITISVEVKEFLDSMRGNKSWEDFLLELARKAKLADKLLALRELERILTMDDAEKLMKIIDQVKLKWGLRE